MFNSNNLVALAAVASVGLATGSTPSYASFSNHSQNAVQSSNTSGVAHSAFRSAATSHVLNTSSSNIGGVASQHTRSFTGAATSIVLGSGAVIAGGIGTSTAGPASKFGDLKLSGSKLSSGISKVIQAEIPPGGIGTSTAGGGTTGTGTTGTGKGGTGTGTGTGGTGTAGTGTAGTGSVGNGGMSHGPRFPGTVIVTNSYPQYEGVHRDYGWSGRYPTTVAPVIARPIVAAAPSCLSKEYLQQGVVMFRDTCTNEWAINKTNTQTASNAACLTKANPQDGVVMFKDICSSEWAMNPAQVPDQAQN
jgi:hypothetical protein